MSFGLLYRRKFFTDVVGDNGPVVIGLKEIADHRVGGLSVIHQIITMRRVPDKEVFLDLPGSHLGPGTRAGAFLGPGEETILEAALGGAYTIDDLIEVARPHLKGH